MICFPRWPSLLVFSALLLGATVTPLYAQSDGTSAPPDDAPLVVAPPDQPPADQAPVVVDIAPADQPPATNVTPSAAPGASVFPAARTKTSGCSSSSGLPDPACTPAALDPRVTQDTIATTICVSGYTDTVRPSTAVTNRIKVQQMAAYGLQGQPLAADELDHLIPLELGGAPADVANLWPEAWTGDASAREKDTVENFLHRQVCSGAMRLIDAQQAIATNWWVVYQQQHPAS